MEQIYLIQLHHQLERIRICYSGLDVLFQLRSLTTFKTLVLPIVSLSPKLDIPCLLVGQHHQTQFLGDDVGIPYRVTGESFDW